MKNLSTIQITWHPISRVLLIGTFIIAALGACNSQQEGSIAPPIKETASVTSLSADQSGAFLFSAGQYCGFLMGSGGAQPSSYDPWQMFKDMNYCNNQAYLLSSPDSGSTYSERIQEMTKNALSYCQESDLQKIVVGAPSNDDPAPQDIQEKITEKIVLFKQIHCQTADAFSKQ